MRFLHGRLAPNEKQTSEILVLPTTTSWLHIITHAETKVLGSLG